jgi:putative transposase
MVAMVIWGKKTLWYLDIEYMVTSNHIHLLVVDGGGRDVIPKSIKLVAGRTAQEYNQRKNRNGAFWEDRYHATAVSSDRHLIQCIVYIDLNMVRATLSPIHQNGISARIMNSRILVKGMH